MKVIDKLIGVTVLMGVHIMLMLPVSFGQRAASRIDSVVSLRKSRITLHEPVVLDLRLTNHSPQSAVVSLGEDDEKLGIEMLDPDGQLSRRPEPALRGFAGNIDAFLVPPTGTSTGSVTLNRWFKFEKLGSYQITVRLSSHSLPKEAFSYSLNTAVTTLSLTVLTYDQESLRSECASLLATIRDPSSPGAALAAARSLSLINDPVAVPFLSEAIDYKSFAGLMIEALARLRTKNAIDALGKAAQSTDPETKRLAQSALTDLGQSADR